MLKHLITAVLTIAVLTLTLASCTSAPPPLPPDEEMRYTVYPILSTKRPMTAVEVHDPGLLVMKLERSIGAFVHFRYKVDQRSDREGHWHYQTVDAGTMVAVDSNGRPWYLLAGSNRLYVPLEQIRNGTATSPSAGQGGPGGWSPWWWLLLPAAAIAILWLWIRQRDGNVDDDPAAADANDPPAHDRIGRIERDVAGIRESLIGLEDRVVTRLEPTVREAVDNGGKARARNALAEQIVAAGSRNNMVLVNALNRALTALE